MAQQQQQDRDRVVVSGVVWQEELASKILLADYKNRTGHVRMAQLRRRVGGQSVNERHTKDSRSSQRTSSPSSVCSPVIKDPVSKKQ